MRARSGGGTPGAFVGDGDEVATPPGGGAAAMAMAMVPAFDVGFGHGMGGVLAEVDQSSREGVGLDGDGGAGGDVDGAGGAGAAELGLDGGLVAAAGGRGAGGGEVAGGSCAPNSTPSPGDSPARDCTFATPLRADIRTLKPPGMSGGLES